MKVIRATRHEKGVEKKIETLELGLGRRLEDTTREWKTQLDRKFNIAPLRRGMGRNAAQYGAIRRKTAEYGSHFATFQEDMTICCMVEHLYFTSLSCKFIHISVCDDILRVQNFVFCIYATSTSCDTQLDQA